MNSKKFKLIKFIIVNILVITIVFYIAYKVHIQALKKNKKKEKTFIHWFNQGNISLKGILVSLIFGIVFGFLDNFFMWIGLDTLIDVIPGGTLTKSALGNTYSDFMGATIGASVSSIAIDIFSVDDSPPIWVNAIGMVIGCILGMKFGKIITKKN